MPHRTSKTEDKSVTLRCSTASVKRVQEIQHLLDMNEPEVVDWIINTVTLEQARVARITRLTDASTE